MKNFLIIAAIFGLCFLGVKIFAPNSEREQEMNEKLDTQYETMMNQLGDTMVAMDGKKGQEDYEKVEEILSGLMGK